MDDTTHDQTEDATFSYEFSDDVLENAALSGNGRANNFTQWMCTALFFAPGPSGEIGYCGTYNCAMTDFNGLT
jgi:hypothetical protein